jgi:hypothetical protein
VAYATVDDVVARFRPLTPEEEALAATLLDDAETRIRFRVRDLDSRVADPEYHKLVVLVEVGAVLRVLRNPEGYRSESDGDYSYTLSVQVASGLLDILDGEWRLLGVFRGAFTIAPTIGAPRCGPLPPRHRGPW